MLSRPCVWPVRFWRWRWRWRWRWACCWRCRHCAASAQEPEFYDRPYAENQWTYGRRLDESQLRYCVDRRDPAWEVAAAIADAIAAGLLLEPQRYVVESNIVLEDITRVYEILLKHCDLHMGFKLIPQGYPEWVTVTRPYYESRYVFVTADPKLTSLADVAPGRTIGAALGTSAHLRLVSYLLALPADKRWPTFPMGTNELALEALLHGRVDVALVWAPNLWAAQRNDPTYEKLHVIDPDPLPATRLGVGALMLSNETFLRTAVDEAIAALVQDGTIAGILETYHVSGDGHALMADAPVSGPAIRVDAVSKRYGRTLALDEVSFDVRDRELFALLGPNGAGKTTLLHILCTILRPDSGVATVGGFDVLRQPLAARRRLGIVFQEPSLDDRLTVHENLNLHGLVYGVPRKLRRQRIDEMLSLVELSKWADTPARTLSSGMKRRLEIARALIHNSEIMLLDEPTVGLDAQTRDRIWSYINRLRNERQITVLVTTHYIEEVETCDRVCIIDHGKVLALDTPEALKRAHGQQLLRIVPRTDGDRQELMRRYADRLASESGEAILLTADDAFAETVLAEHGGRIRSLALEVPSLETVFLSLTGRELRDAVAGARERTLAFGKRGGEHTR